MNDPVKFLEYFRADLLEKEGYIYLEVPLIENSRGDYLLNELHISHKWYFTNLSLKLCAEMAGFEVVYESRNLLIIKSNCHAALVAASGSNCDSESASLTRPRDEHGVTKQEMLALSNKVLAELA
jgi:ABC-type antimicrobial peptide transport system ATPase subunit